MLSILLDYGIESFSAETKRRTEEHWHVEKPLQRQQKSIALS